MKATSFVFPSLDKIWNEKRLLFLSIIISMLGGIVIYFVYIILDYRILFSLFSTITYVFSVDPSYGWSLIWRLSLFFLFIPAILLLSTYLLSFLIIYTNQTQRGKIDKKMARVESKKHLFKRFLLVIGFIFLQICLYIFAYFPHFMVFQGKYVFPWLIVLLYILGLLAYFFSLMLFQFSFTHLILRNSSFIEAIRVSFSILKKGIFPVLRIFTLFLVASVIVSLLMFFINYLLSQLLKILINTSIVFQFSFLTNISIALGLIFSYIIFILTSAILLAFFTYIWTAYYNQIKS